MVIFINNLITIDDLIKLSKKPYYYPQIKKDPLIMWKTKIDYLEEYYNSVYSIDTYDFNYFRGLTDISLNILKKINYLNLTYGISFNRFYIIKTLYDLYYPLNSSYGPIVNSFSEFIKYEYFYNNRKVEYQKINLNLSDSIYFIARLIFPTYYFDLFKDDRITRDFPLIINKINGYLEYVKEIINDIKKRHNNMPFAEYIINLL